jgi:hypothetical protein
MVRFLESTPTERIGHSRLSAQKTVSMSTGIRVHVAGIGVQVRWNTQPENPGKASEITSVAMGVI